MVTNNRLVDKLERKPTLDPGRHTEFTARFKPYGCAVVCHRSSIQRLCYWHVIAKASDDGWMLTTGFDIDLDRVLKQLDAGVPLRDVQVLPNNSRTLTPVRHRNLDAPDRNLTGGPWCFICGHAGGLPSPNMLKGASQAGIKLAFPEGDARLAAASLHPGRCRKSLRGLLTTAGIQ